MSTPITPSPPLSPPPSFPSLPPPKRSLSVRSKSLRSNFKRPCISNNTPSLAPPPSDRSIKSYATAAFSENTKRHLRSKYGDRCWVCKAFPAQAAHVINRIDDQFQYIRNAGIIDFTALGNETNAMLLCPLCHAEYYALNPGLVIVPSDLDWFVQWELRDREHRIAEFKVSGTMPQRISPTEDYAKHRTTKEATYVHYIRVDYFAVVGNRQPLAPGVLGGGIWNGSPTAVIEKAFHAASVLIGLPRDMIKALDRLKMLWFIEDPALEFQDTVAANDGDHGKSEEDADEPRQPPPHNPPSPGHPESPKSGSGDDCPTPPDNTLPVAQLSLAAPLPKAWVPLSISTRGSDGHEFDRLLRLPGNLNGWEWGPREATQSVIDYYKFQLGCGGSSG